MTTGLWLALIGTGGLAVLLAAAVAAYAIRRGYGCKAELRPVPPPPASAKAAVAAVPDRRTA